MEVDFNPIIDELPVTGDYDTDMSCAIGFMTSKMFTPDTAQWICLTSEAEIIINGRLKEHFKFKARECKTLLSYFREHAPKPRKEIKQLQKFKGRGARLRQELMNDTENNAESNECEEIDPLDIDWDEKDIDPALLEYADEEAERMLNTGDPVKFIKESVAKFHTGDEDTIEGLCISTAGQSILNTDGIQIAVNGDSGSGKSHGAIGFMHHIPARWKRETDLSAKALYYMELRPGITVFSDDKDMDPDIASVFKQSTTRYQKETYRTVVKEQKRLILSIPPRINLLITCVESHVSDQVLNRQLIFETDVSDNQKFAIYQKQKSNEKEKITKLTVTPEVLICRRIFAKIKEQQYNVLIPFVDRIDFADYSNTRIQPLLFDMIRGYAMFKFKQRQVDEDGWLVATYEDYHAAEKLFKSRAENTVTKLSKPELEIYKFIIANQRSVGCSVNEIAGGINMDINRIKRLINGRSDRADEAGGMLAKVKGMTKESVNDTDYIRGNEGELKHSRGRHEFRYKIDGYNLWDLFSSDFITLYED